MKSIQIFFLKIRTFIQKTYINLLSKRDEKDGMCSACGCEKDKDHNCNAY